MAGDGTARAGGRSHGDLWSSCEWESAWWAIIACTSSCIGSKQRGHNPGLSLLRGWSELKVCMAAIGRACCGHNGASASFIRRVVRCLKAMAFSLHDLVFWSGWWEIGSVRPVVISNAMAYSSHVVPAVGGQGVPLAGQRMARQNHTRASLMPGMKGHGRLTVGGRPRAASGMGQLVKSRASPGAIHVKCGHFWRAVVAVVLAATGAAGAAFKPQVAFGAVVLAVGRR